MVVQCRSQKLVGCKLIPTIVSSFCLLTLLAYLFFLNSCRRLSLFFVSEMDAERQKALVRKATAACKQQDQASRSTPNVALKATLKRKNNAKDAHLPKKGIGPLIKEQ